MRPISSRSRELSFARSAAIFSCDERVSWASVESALSNSERNLAKSTFCVYVDRSESIEASKALNLATGVFQSTRKCLLTTRRDIVSSQPCAR